MYVLDVFSSVKGRTCTYSGGPFFISELHMHTPALPPVSTGRFRRLVRQRQQGHNVGVRQRAGAKQGFKGFNFMCAITGVIFEERPPRKDGLKALSISRVIH